MNNVTYITTAYNTHGYLRIGINITSGIIDQVSRITIISTASSFVHFEKFEIAEIFSSNHLQYKYNIKNNAEKKIVEKEKYILHGLLPMNMTLLDLPGCETALCSLYPPLMILINVSSAE